MATASSKGVQCDARSETSHKVQTRLSLDEDDEDDRHGTLFLPIQQHSRPATPSEIVFERDVLALPRGKTEKELNKHFTLAAGDLGLEIGRNDVRETDERRHLTGTNDSALTLGSSLRDSVSRTSQSTPPTSCGSSEMQTRFTHSYQPPSIVASSRPISSRPPSVLSSTKSISSSIRSGFRRLSSLSRRTSKAIELPVTESTPSIDSSNPAYKPSIGRRPSTSQSTVVPQSPSSTATPSHYSDAFSTYHNNVPKMLNPPSSLRANRGSHRSLSRGQSLPSIASVSSAGARTTVNFSTPFKSPPGKSSDSRTLHSYRPLTPTREEGFTPAHEQAAAEARTARNRDLQQLRVDQVKEQQRFLEFQRDQHGRIRSKHSDRVRAHRKLWAQKEEDLERIQSEKEMEMEQRQLNAELEMVHTMEAEKKSVEARLRHMEGYVKGRSIYGGGSGTTSINTDDAASTDGSLTDAAGSDRDSGLHLVHSQFPARVVSSHSMAMLGQQYRIRSQLPQLHRSRIKVLREQQSQRLARLQARHAVEFDTLQQEAADASDELENILLSQETELRHEFEKRRGRMEWRWKVAESMERKRLEEERGLSYAEMKLLEWNPDAWKGEG